MYNLCLFLTLSISCLWLLFATYSFFLSYPSFACAYVHLAMQCVVSNGVCVHTFPPIHTDFQPHNNCCITCVVKWEKIRRMWIVLMMPTRTHNSLMFVNLLNVISYLLIVVHAPNRIVEVEPDSWANVRVNRFVNTQYTYSIRVVLDRWFEHNIFN